MFSTYICLWCIYSLLLKTDEYSYNIDGPYTAPQDPNDGFIISPPNTCAIYIEEGEGSVLIGNNPYGASAEESGGKVIETRGMECIGGRGVTVIWITGTPR